MRKATTHPNKQGQPKPVGNVTGTRDRLGLVCTVAGQDSIALGVLVGGRVQPLEQSETSSLPLSGAELQADENLRNALSQGSPGHICGALTYFNSGISVMAHMIALIPPITSSLDGAGPLAAQIPFKTYKGDVPMSE